MLNSLQEKLFEAIECNLIDEVENILRSGVNVNIRNNYKDSPLHCAVNSNSIEIVKLLLKYESLNINILDSRGETALHYAARNDFDEIAEILIKNGADVNIKSVTTNQNFFTIAVYFNSVKTVKVAIANNLNVNEKDGEKVTPLHVAVANDLIDIVELLLNAGADVNIKNSDNETPLFIAVTNDSIDIVELLLNAGADVNIKCSYMHETVLKVAEEEGFNDILKLLKTKVDK